MLPGNVSLICTNTYIYIFIFLWNLQDYVYVFQHQPL